MSLYTLYAMILLPLLANPNTGDRNAGIMGFVVAALILSALLIVIYLITSKKKKGNGKKRK